MDTNPNLNSPQLLKSLEPTYSLNEIAALRDLFQSLSKGVKASRQYPNDHPTPVQFKGFFLEKLRSFFELSESVAVSVN